MATSIASETVDLVSGVEPGSGPGETLVPIHRDAAEECFGWQDSRNRQ